MASEQRRNRTTQVSYELSGTHTVPIHNMPSKLNKPAYDAQNTSFFERTIRAQIKSQEEIETRKFVY